MSRRPTSVRGVLLGAADRIEQTGLAKRTFYRRDPETGPVCLTGAIWYAATGNPEADNDQGTEIQRDLAYRAEYRMTDFLQTKNDAYAGLNDAYAGLAVWSDQPGRGRTQVVKVLREVAG